MALNDTGVFGVDGTEQNSFRGGRPDLESVSVLMLTRGVVPLSVRSGGAERVGYQLARTLLAHRSTVTIVTDVDGRLPDEHLIVIPVVGATVRRFVSRLPGGLLRWILQHLLGNLAVTWTAWRQVKRNPTAYDVIHAHGNLSTILLSFLVRVPIIYTEHDATPWLCRYRYAPERVIRKVLYRLLNVTAWRRASRVVVNFDVLARVVIERWRIDPEKVRCIVNGIDVDAFTPTVVEGSAPELVPFPRYCLFVGTLEQRKSPDLLLRALVEAPEVCCVVVGDGPLRPRLQKLARELNVRDRVAFTGPLPPVEVARLFAKADFLVQPSVSEGMSLVVLEALATCTPILASRVGGAPAVVDDWKTGFLVKPGDVGQLAMGMRFLHGDNDLRHRMATACKQRGERLAWPLLIPEYLALYRLVAHGALDPYPTAVSHTTAAPAISPTPISVDVAGSPAEAVAVND